MPASQPVELLVGGRRNTTYAVPARYAGNFAPGRDAPPRRLTDDERAAAARAGQMLADALAGRPIAAAWKAAGCDGFDIKSVRLEGEPRFQLETVADRAKAKRWYVYQVQIDAVGTGKFRLSKDGVPYVNRLQHMLLWDAAGSTWSVEPRHVRCTSFSEAK